MDSGFRRNDGLLRPELCDQRVPVDLPMGGDFREDRGESADAQRTMIRNREAVWRSGALKPDMTAGLPHDAIADPRKGLDEFRGANVARQLHAASTSSLT